jgi:hypothetical protein
MSLDYRPKMMQTEHPMEQPKPMEQLPFFSNKASDQYTSFINMQNVVNAALQKQAYQPNPNDKTELTVASGERYNV